jgi:D-arabinose 1-dehydrogenase-like Zn-dependent alcohol dehydrogenase
LPAAVEAATRALDQLGVNRAGTGLINGASGTVGSAAVQLAVVRGARVIGTGSPATHEGVKCAAGSCCWPTEQSASPSTAAERHRLERRLGADGLELSSSRRCL